MSISRSSSISDVALPSSYEGSNAATSQIEHCPAFKAVVSSSVIIKTSVDSRRETPGVAATFKHAKSENSPRSAQRPTENKELTDFIQHIEKRVNKFFLQIFCSPGSISRKPQPDELVTNRHFNLANDILRQLREPIDRTNLNRPALHEKLLTEFHGFAPSMETFLLKMRPILKKLRLPSDIRLGEKLLNEEERTSMLPPDMPQPLHELCSDVLNKVNLARLCANQKIHEGMELPAHVAQASKETPSQEIALLQNQKMEEASAPSSALDRPQSTITSSTGDILSETYCLEAKVEEETIPVTLTFDYVKDDEVDHHDPDALSYFDAGPLGTSGASPSVQQNDSGTLGSNSAVDVSPQITLDPQEDMLDAPEDDFEGKPGQTSGPTSSAINDAHIERQLQKYQALVLNGIKGLVDLNTLIPNDKTPYLKMNAAQFQEKVNEHVASIGKTSALEFAQTYMAELGQIWIERTRNLQKLSDELKEEVRELRKNLNSNHNRIWDSFQDSFQATTVDPVPARDEPISNAAKNPTDSASTDTNSKQSDPNGSLFQN